MSEKRAHNLIMANWLMVGMNCGWLHGLNDVAQKKYLSSLTGQFLGPDRVPYQLFVTFFQIGMSCSVLASLNS